MKSKHKNINSKTLISQGKAEIKLLYRLLDAKPKSKRELKLLKK